MSYGNILPFGEATYGQISVAPSTDVANSITASQSAVKASLVPLYKQEPYGVSAYGEVIPINLLSAQNKLFQPYGVLSYGELAPFGGENTAISWGLGSKVLVTQSTTALIVENKDVLTYGSAVAYGDVRPYGSNEVVVVIGSASNAIFASSSTTAAVIKETLNTVVATQSISHAVFTLKPVSSNVSASQGVTYSFTYNASDSVTASQRIAYEPCVNNSIVAVQATTTEISIPAVDAVHALQVVTSSRDFILGQDAQVIRARQYVSANIFKAATFLTDLQLGNVHHKRKKEFDAANRGVYITQYNVLGD